MNAADTAWVLGCAALVMFMTPGLALFYGGMLRAKSGRIGAHITTAAVRAAHGPSAAAARSGPAR